MVLDAIREYPRPLAVSLIGSAWKAAPRDDVAAAATDDDGEEEFVSERLATYVFIVNCDTRGPCIKRIDDKTEADMKMLDLRWPDLIGAHPTTVTDLELSISLYLCKWIEWADDHTLKSCFKIRG